MPWKDEKQICSINFLISTRKGKEHNILVYSLKWEEDIDNNFLQWNDPELVVN